MTEEEKNEEESTVPSQIRDIENGIFNMVITLCRHLETKMESDAARRYVASYLDRLAQGLHQVDNPDEGTTP